MALKPKIYKDKLITKYVDNESAALHDNVQISHNRLNKVRAGAGLFQVVESRPGTTSDKYASLQASRSGTRHRKTPSKTFNLIDNMMDANQASAQISEFLQNYMSTNTFDEQLFVEKEQFITDYFKEKFRLMGIFLGENILSELLHKAKNKDQKGFNDQVNGIINNNNSPKNSTDRKFTLTLSTEEAVMANSPKKSRNPLTSKRSETESSKKQDWVDVDKRVLSEYELEKYEGFKEKFKAMGIHLGESLLSQLKDNKKKKFLDDLDEEKKDLQQYAFNNENEELALKDHALTKVLKINKDIIQQILREEHENKLKKLEQLQVEQNMQVFNALSENTRLTFVNPDTVKKRSLSPKEKVQRLPKVIVKTNFLREELFEEADDLNDLDVFYNKHQDPYSGQKDNRNHDFTTEKKPNTATAIMSTTKSNGLLTQNPRPNTVGFKFRYGKFDFTNKIASALDTHKFNNEDGHIRSVKNSDTMKHLTLSNFNSPVSQDLRFSRGEGHGFESELKLQSPTSQFAPGGSLFPQTTASVTKTGSVDIRPDFLLSESIDFLSKEKDRVIHEFKAKYKAPQRPSKNNILHKKKASTQLPRPEELPSPINSNRKKPLNFFEDYQNSNDMDPNFFEEEEKKDKPLFPKVLYPRKQAKPTTASPSPMERVYRKTSSRDLIKVNRLQPSMSAKNTMGQMPNPDINVTGFGSTRAKMGNFYTRYNLNLASKEALFEEKNKSTEQFRTQLKDMNQGISLNGLMVQAGVAQMQSFSTKNERKNKFNLTTGAGMWKNNS